MKCLVCKKEIGTHKDAQLVECIGTLYDLPVKDTFTDAMMIASSKEYLVASGQSAANPKMFRVQLRGQPVTTLGREALSHYIYRTILIAESEKAARKSVRVEDSKEEEPISEDA